MGGSDLHITTNSAPRVRVHGRLLPLDMPPLTAADTKSLAYSVLTDAQKHRFEENLDLDFFLRFEKPARFRGNVFNQRGAVGAVVSVQFPGKSKVLTLSDCPGRKGLVWTSPAGSSS